ncbi:MAG: DNA replication/repair protein RecF [Actinobacteria bacterium]|nr:MAG: DNA replication/repair protein RecF [Actinomycetota bacterium]
MYNSIVYLKKLELKNYRNYSYVNLNFDKNTILILGNNGNGKTNLLESIYYLSTGRSHRTYSQDEIIKWGSDYSIIKALIGSEKNNGIDHLIEIELRKENNIKIRVDKIYQRKKSDFISMLPSVIFSPDDLKIVKSGPSDRRNFLDSILEKLDWKYYRQRLQYQKILVQRSSLIKSISGRAGAASNSTLEVWNDNIVRYGTDIIEKRYRLLAEFRDEFRSYVNSFFKGVEVDLFYVFSWDRGDNLDEYTDYFNAKSYKKENFIENNLKDIFYRKLIESLQKDLLYKTTTVGPHRDDFIILLNGKNIRSFGSQGQQRVASISLKLCELDILRKRIKKDPILLLDDVFSELDIERRKLLVKAVSDRFQTFVTTTNISYLDKLDLEFGNKLLIKDNKIAVSNL